MIFYKRMSPVKIISFDLDDTLYDNIPVIANAEKVFASYLCKKYFLPDMARDPDFWMIMRSECCIKDPKLEDDMSLWRQKSLQRGLKKFGIVLDEKSATDEVKRFVRIRSDFKVPASSLKLLENLKKNYHLVALSNGNSDLNQNGLAPYFDLDLRPSYAGDRRKPSSDLFLRAASFFNVSPYEILHIGDDPVTDVRGAVGAGCQCIWFCGGFAGLNAGWENIRVLPHVQISKFEDLRRLLSA